MSKIKIILSLCLVTALAICSLLHSQNTLKPEAKPRPRGEVVKSYGCRVESILMPPIKDGQFNASHLPLPILSWRDISIVTQSDDLDIRSRWQRQQVRRFCRKYGQDKQLYTLPPHDQTMPLYQHLMFSRKNKYLFCYLPKAGSTNLRRLLYVMEGLMPLESVHWHSVIGSKYLHSAIAQSSFKSTSLTNKDRIFQMKHYFKFMMIRNPLERLVSAYRDKIEPPLEFCDHDRLSDPLVTDLHSVGEMDLFQAHRRLILSKYHPRKLMKWVKDKGRSHLSVDFPTYVRWIVETKDSDLNEHFSSILFNAAPCRVGYHLFLNFKNYSRDVRLLIRRLNTSSDLFVDRSSHSSPGSETHSTLPHYYSQLSANLKRRLFARMTRELDFYYHLYPEEQLSHEDLLGVKQHVYSGKCRAE